MNYRSKILMFVSLGAAAAMAFVGAGCELLVTFPASEITEGGLDGFTSDSPTGDVQSDTGKPGDSGKDVVTTDGAPDSAEDSATDAGGDAPGDAPATDTGSGDSGSGDSGGSDAPTDAPGDGG